MPRDVPSWAASQGQQALAASCRDCSAGWLPQEHTHVSWCRDCTEAFRQGRQAPAASCRDCTAARLPQERTRIDWCTDYIAAAAPPLNLGDIEKAQMRTLAWQGTQFIPHSRVLTWWSPATGSTAQFFTTELIAHRLARSVPRQADYDYVAWGKADLAFGRNARDGSPHRD